MGERVVRVKSHMRTYYKRVGGRVKAVRERIKGYRYVRKATNVAGRIPKRKAGVATAVILVGGATAYKYGRKSKKNKRKRNNKKR